MKTKTVREYSNELEYRSTVTRIGWSLVFFVGVLYVSTVVSQLFAEDLFGNSANNIQKYILYSAAYMFSFMIPALFYKIISGRSRIIPKINLKIKLPKYAFLYIIIGFAVTRGAAYLNSFILNLAAPGATASEESIMSLNEFICNVMYIALVPAICEEFLFRGMILGNLLSHGKTVAIIGSAVLFGLMHQQIYQIFYTTVAGIVFGLIYVNTGSLWCGMLFHFANNFLSVLEDYIYSAYGEKTCGIFTAILFASSVILGIISAMAICIIKSREDNSYSGGFFEKKLEKSNNYIEKNISTERAVQYFFAPGNLLFIIISVIIMTISMIAL